MLVLLVAFELSYYLLVIQTGIVEFYSSNIYLLATLPLGGVVGSLISFYIKKHKENILSFFIFVQLLISLLYPDLSQVLLFILGLTAGIISIIMINLLKYAKPFELGMALSISYTFGTLLFNCNVADRGVLAISLSLVVLVASRLLPSKEFKTVDSSEQGLIVMLVWVLLDSTLFEALSRDNNISIWRDGFSIEIALFHILGVILALSIKLSNRTREIVILSLFAMSYLLYYLKLPYLLSAIYPIAISYYNIVILQTILKKELKTIAVYMLFIAWIASGLGLFIALNGLVFYQIVLFLFLLFEILKNKKGSLNV